MISAGVARMADKWFIDDGQLYLHPMAAEPVLRVLDKYLEEAGASRGSLSNGDDIKSSACLFCEPSRLPEFAGWDTHATLAVSDLRTRR